MKKLVTIIVLVAAVQLVLVSATYAAPPAWGGGEGTHHKVYWGETLHSIGRTYDAQPQCIAHANGLWDPNVIYAGQVLYVPASCPPYPWHAMYPPQPCHYDCGYPVPEQPIYHPKPPHPMPNPCNTGCYDQGYYGYDYTGYYYGNGQGRYSHTCGYNNNCW